MTWTIQFLAFLSSTVAFAAPSNTISAYVNSSSYGKNQASIDVVICVPGTNTCQTIPHIDVDTGSTGLRIFAKAIKIPLNREVERGNTIAQCAWNYWGYLKTADVRLGGLKAANVSIEVIENNDPNTPSDCGEDDEYNPNSYNGIIGLSPGLNDTMPWAYYTCNDRGCSSAEVPSQQQTQNIIAAFPSDNNGFLMRFPSVPDTGAKSVMGQIIFGIGTRDNNQPSSGLVQISTVGSTWGQFHVQANGKTYLSAFDSGTAFSNFPFQNLPICSDRINLCPQTPMKIPLKIVDARGNPLRAVTLDVLNYEALPEENWAFSKVGAQGTDETTLMFGFSFFLGKTMYFAFDNRNTPLGLGPWVGY